MPSENNSNIQTVYQQLCESYRAIDDFRAKLLGYLPLATGGVGVSLILASKEYYEFVSKFLPVFGFFGLLVTIGLFFYEIFGIKKCTYIIEAGKRLEGILGTKMGQFKTRPDGIFKLINEPLASGTIYSAVIASWAFFALDFNPCKSYASFSFCDVVWSMIFFFLFFGSSLGYNIFLVCWGIRLERRKYKISLKAFFRLWRKKRKSSA